MDKGEYYPHHNIYYITSDSLDDLKTLGAIMMSKMFAQSLATQSVMMHGGFVRHQSQNLRAVRIPQIKQISAAVRKNLKRAFDDRDLDAVDEISEKQFGLVPDEPIVQHH